MQNSLANAFAAAGFNAIGDFTQDSVNFSEGSLSKAALHGVMGGLAAEATGGDFKTGALAAGINELLVDKLANEYAGMSPDKKAGLLVMNSQLIGVLAAAATGGVNDADNLQVGAKVAADSTQYNYLSHEQEVQRDRERDECRGFECVKVEGKWALIDSGQDAALASGVMAGVPISMAETVEDLFVLFDGDTYTALGQLLEQDNVLATLGSAVVQDYRQRLENIHQEYQRAGASGAFNAGLEVGKLATELVSSVGKAPVMVMTTAKRAGNLADSVADASKVIPDGAHAGGLPEGSIELRPGVSAQVNAPKGYKVYQSPDGDRYYVSPTGETYSSLGDIPRGGTSTDVTNAPTRAGNVEEGEVGPYGDLASRSVKDGMTPDHIPSFAATKQAVSDAELDLSDAQLRALKNNTNCVVVRTCDHQSFSRTYGGRNSQTQIQTDAQDLYKAAEADLDTWEPVWRKNGWSDADIANARRKVHEYNKQTFEELGIDYGSD
ncbi:DUF637 domain-containing protein [Halomonas binhaiensis]|uniref:DUF637 domain-containing protein n=1 Tax=Halomonas binhaiensis TaxID=2562282 RepID=A0A856QLU7_9GAMM|nr:DUF637 domain-containing protein [Halomonas binhaiensis]